MGPRQSGWWVMKYRVSFEFRLTRRTIWAADGIDFYDHATEVAEKIGSHEFVSDVRVIADRSESVLTVDFAQEASDHNEIVPRGAWCRPRGYRGCRWSPFWNGHHRGRNTCRRRRRTRSGYADLAEAARRYRPRCLTAISSAVVLRSIKPRSSIRPIASTARENKPTTHLPATDRALG